MIYEGKLETETNRNAVIFFMEDKQRNKQTMNYFATELLHVTTKHDRRTGGAIVQLSVTVVLY